VEAVKVYATKRYNNDGTFEVLARKPTIEKALYQHLQALKNVEEAAEIVTTNPKGIIYGYGWDIQHFKNNGRCSFCLRYGFEDRFKE
jgi:hypothetical protein